MSLLAGMLPDTSPLREFPSFRSLWFGQLGTQIGGQMRTVAIPYHVFSLTGSPLDVGLLGLFQAVPLLVSALFGGVIVDSFDRRRILIVAQSGLCATALALASITQLGAASVPLLYLLTSLGAAFIALDQTTRGTLTPTLVERRRLAAAITLQQTLAQTVLCVGPAIGGVVIAGFGVGGAYWINAAGFALSVLFSRTIRPPKAPRPPVRPPALRAAADGLRYVVRNRILLAALLVDFFAMFLAWPTALFPFYAEEVFHAGPQGFGLLAAAPGLGAVLAAVTAGWIPRLRRHGAAILIAIVLWGLAIAAFGMLGSGFFALAVLLIAFAYAADQASAILRTTLLQSTVQEEMRGRLTSIFIIFVYLGPTLGETRAGVVGTLVSPQFAMVSGGVAAALSAVAFMILTPRLLRYRPTDDVERTPT